MTRIRPLGLAAVLAVMFIGAVPGIGSATQALAASSPPAATAPIGPPSAPALYVPAAPGTQAATATHHSCTMPTNKEKHEVIGLADSVKLRVQPVLPEPPRGDACQWFPPKSPLKTGYFVYQLGKAGYHTYQSMLKLKGLAKPTGKGILKGTRCLANTYWQCFIWHSHHFSDVAGLKTKATKRNVELVLAQLAVLNP